MCTTWWRQFGGKDEWTPDSVVKSGCDGKIRSIHEEELSRICVGSLIICYSPNCDVIFSNTLPWEVVLSLKYQLSGFKVTNSYN